MNDVKSLSHSKWRCKYHIVFVPKYRRQVIYNQIKVDTGKILQDLCKRKGVEILEEECCPDHIHMGSLSNVVEKYYRKISGCLCSTTFPCFVIENIEDAATEVFKVPKSVADTL